jgi:hypothetical protein
MKTQNIGLILAVILSAACSKEQPGPPPLDLHPGEFISAVRCGDCHSEIYRVWSGSLHATSWRNATFQSSLKEVQGGTDATQSCMSCHAPVARHSQTAAAQLMNEGVTCDWCHSIKSVDAKKKPILVSLDIGAGKYGPVPNAHSTGHPATYSDLHSSSEACSGCHEYENSQGLQVLGTFSEWQASDFAKAGMTCQRCHMPLAALYVVDPRVKREPSSSINLHQMPGGHSKDQLFKALDMRVSEVTRHGAALQVEVLVHNKGAGHSVPTGMPTRRIVLTTEINGERTGKQTQTRVYGATVQDRAGKLVDQDAAVITSGAKFVANTRLKPGEKRTENFSFKIDPDENIQIRTVLTYRYEPLGSGQPGLEIEFSEKDKESLMQYTPDRIGKD